MSVVFAIYLICVVVVAGCGSHVPPIPASSALTETPADRVPSEPAVELANPTSTVTPTFERAVRPALPPRTVASSSTEGPSPTSTALAGTPTPNPFGFLTALALTPTRRPEPPQPPVRLTIPRVGLDVRVLPAGLDRHGVPIVLKHDVAWFDQSGMPAGGTNIVFWAHVLRFKDAPTIPAPFANVWRLQHGDRIIVTNAAGKRYTYAVIAQIRVRPDQVEYLAPTPLEQLLLVSCIGDTVFVNGELTKTQRLMTIAAPIQ